MLLEVRDVAAGYGRAQVLHGVSFGCPAGSLTAIVGANGAGKTTLMRALAGSILPSRGLVSLDGEDVTRLAPHERLARGLALVPEGRSAFPDLTVEENLRLGGHRIAGRGPLERRIREMETLFPRLGERRRQAARTLSGGEQQMLVIARALMTAPRVLLLDEPSVGLAPQVVDQIFDIIGRVRASGTTIVLVEQNLGPAMALSDEALVVEHGHVVLSGSARELATDARVRAAYLGL